MSEQISMPAGSGLLTLNISVSSSSGSSLAPGGALFSGFGSVLSQLPEQGAGLASGAFLPQSGASLPQVSDDGLLPDITMEQKMLYIAQMLEQQYGEGAELPPEITAELAQALKEFAEQRTTLSNEGEVAEVESSDVEVGDDLAVAGVVGPPILLSDLEESMSNGALYDALKAKFNEFSSGTAALSDDAEMSDDAVRQNGRIAGLVDNVVNADGLKDLSEIVNQRSADQLALINANRDERAALFQAQVAADDSSSDMAAAAQLRASDEMNKAAASSVVAQNLALKSNNERASGTVLPQPVDDEVDSTLDPSLKRDNSAVGRVSERADLLSASYQKEMAADLAAKAEVAAKPISGKELPEKFESALELSKQLLQKVTSNEKVSDSSFNQRMETLVLAQTQQASGVNQPTQAQKVVSDAQNLMMPQQVQINTPAWKNALGERAIMVSTQNLNVANIQLDPPELGALSIKVHINQDQVSLSFTSPHAHVRDAVEQSLPRLREMFAEQGLSLQDSSVADQSADQQRREQFAEQGEKGASGSSYMESGEAGGEESLSQVESKPMSLVDYYA